MEREYIFKISVIGEEGVGKHSLVRRYLNRPFEISSPHGVALDIAINENQIKNSIVTLQICVIEGKTQFYSLIPIYSRGSSVSIFMFDITKRNTLGNIVKLIPLFD
jgi:GTPase SAR1 family protein